MRLLMKTNEGLVNMYWATVDGSSIYGWCSGQSLNKELNISPDFPPHFHFRYPADGNYHFSTKSFKTDPQIFVTVFWDKVKIKTVSNNIPTTTELDRTSFSDHQLSLLGHLMASYPPLAISTTTIFQFPSIGFNIFSGDFNKNARNGIVADNDVTDDDLIVDITGLDNYSVNVFCHIRALTHTRVSTPHIKSQNINETHVLEIGCTVQPNPGI